MFLQLKKVLFIFAIISVGGDALAATTAVASISESTETVTSNVREHYTKYEYQVPMRDGTRLFTVIYVPKDKAHTYPFLMVRTPYGTGVHYNDELHYGVDFYPKNLGPSKDFEDCGYIFVNQDVRGRYMSEGVWQEMTPHNNSRLQPGQGIESQDMHDTVDWLLKNIPGNNGKVGIWGISYPGFYTSASIIDSHPAIKAASPQAPVTDLFMGDDSYHGGAFMLAANFDFYSSFTTEKNPTPLPKNWGSFDYGTKDAYQYFLKYQSLKNIAAQLSDKQRELFMPNVEHSTYDDFWKSRNIAPHLKNIKAAVLTVGGWYDAEDVHGPVATYDSIKANNKGQFNGLVLGPWVHGGWAGADGRMLGDVDFGAKTGEYYRKNILFPFFEHYLKGVEAKPLAEATVFETGTNVWREYASWPPQQAQSKTLYFGADRTLSWTPPAATAAAYDEYVSDPKKPVPYISYVAIGVPREYMVSDQRFASTRSDVLVYQSEVLQEDVTVVGPVMPKLFVSSTGTDADWVVKLIDVYPSDYPDEHAPRERGHDVPPPTVTMAGYQQLVRGEPMRAKFRNSFERPEPLVANQITPLTYKMPDINHTFRRGHRIMVQVQSSWFPLVDLNPQQFMDIPKANPEDFQKATQRVYRAPGQYSGIAVQVLAK
ncbi:CocE/NonD family hydrolase [Undibacterium jejuense]|uniref:CocE/NonD family hydrolase n=1 Tax=Undibacterium jejuense TaxID=1344949 RepID=A0A923HJ23_9BURK|nr:CocE/NonD family hydrolase [Undibacterium jejuense]MBC3863328.1 CocE/NonD family hydrolase [Undibacterium jejuense]